MTDLLCDSCSNQKDFEYLGKESINSTTVRYRWKCMKCNTELTRDEKVRPKRLPPSKYRIKTMDEIEHELKKDTL